MAAKYRDRWTSVPESTSISEPEEDQPDHAEDPYCDLCFEETGHKIKIEGFCPECNVFICKTCLDAHKKIPASRNHTIMRGDQMPKSQDDKPIKYPDCEKHIGNKKDQFCIGHGEMVCKRCVEASHHRCKYNVIPDLCEGLGSEDLQNLKGHIKSIQRSVESTKSVVETNITDLEVSRNEMTREVHEIRDKLVAKVEQLCSDMESEVSHLCNTKTSGMSHQVLVLSELSRSLTGMISNITKLSSAKFGPYLFMKIQDIIQNARHFEKEIERMNKDLKKIDIILSISPEVSVFISDCKELGSIKETASNLGTVKSTPKIAFPPLPDLISKAKRKERHIDILKTRTSQLSPLTVRTTCDKYDSKVIGMDLTSNGLLVLGDWTNRKVKVFSPKNKFLSAMALPGNLYNVTVLNDKTVISTTDEEKLYAIDISNPNEICVDKQIPMRYSVTNMTACEDDLVVIKWNEPRCIKKIDIDGHELWSTSSEKSGQPLFKAPYSVAVTAIVGQSMVIVTDWGKETLTFLNASNGDFIKIVDLRGFGPRGLTVDGDSNIYTCFAKTSEIFAWSADMKQKRVILPSSSLSTDPIDILYNNNTGELLVAYRSYDKIDRFQLTDFKNVSEVIKPVCQELRK